MMQPSLLALFWYLYSLKISVRVVDIYIICLKVGIY